MNVMVPVLRTASSGRLRAARLMLLAAFAPGCILPGAELSAGSSEGNGGGASSTNGTTSGSSSSGGGSPGTTASSASGGGGQGGSSTGVTGAGGGGGSGAGGRGDGGSGAGGSGAGGRGEGGSGAGGSGAGGAGGGASTTSSTASTGAGGEGGGGPLAASVSAVTAGLGHACVTRDDGSGLCWGRNDRGQLGFDTSPLLHGWAPDLLTGLGGDARAIATGDRHTCAMVAMGVATRVRCWGENADDQAGGELADQPAIIELVAGGADVLDVVEVAAGWRFGCARRASGSVVCWGDGAEGGLGGGVAPDSPVAVAVPLSDEAVALAASASSSRGCAVIQGGTVQCWGDRQPVETVPGIADAQSVAVAAADAPPPFGPELVFVINADARVLWTRRGAVGWQVWQELGEFGETADDARKVVAGPHEVCVVTTTDALHCAPYAADIPGAIVEASGPGTVSDVALGAAGSGHTGAGFGFRCVLGTDGRTRCQGSNVQASIGNDAPLLETVPFPLASPVDVRALALGATGTLALSGDAATPTAWGTSTVMGVDRQIAPVPSIVPSGLARVSFGSAGASDAYTWSGAQGLGLLVGAVPQSMIRLLGQPYNFVEAHGQLVRDIGRTADGRVFTYSRSTGIANDDGAMGVGNDAAVTAGTGVLLDLGGFLADEVLGVPSAGHHCVRGMAGVASQLLCWGRSDLGQVGNGSTTSVHTPTVVLGPDVVDACLAGSRTCAVAGPAGTGEVLCWGSEVGGGGSSSTPAVVAGTTGAAGVACGADFVCAWLEDGTALCWGDNDLGQLGDGTLVTRPGPAPVAGLDDVREIVAGAQHACARHESGAVSCWGRNENGQVGAGVPLVYPSLVDVALPGGGG